MQEKAVEKVEEIVEEKVDVCFTELTGEAATDPLLHVDSKDRTLKDLLSNQVAAMLVQTYQKAQLVEENIIMHLLRGESNESEFMSSLQFAQNKYIKVLDSFLNNPDMLELKIDPNLFEILFQCVCHNVMESKNKVSCISEYCLQNYIDHNSGDCDCRFEQEESLEEKVDVGNGM